MHVQCFGENTKGPKTKNVQVEASDVGLRRSDNARNHNPRDFMCCNYSDLTFFGDF